VRLPLTGVVLSRAPHAKVYHRKGRAGQAHEEEEMVTHPEPTMHRRETQTDYIREAIKDDLRTGRFDRVHTRFPPEPNAYLHIGHAKAVWIDYGIALDFDGLFNLRFDDTNPTREEQEFVDGIIEDVRWLGADWGDRLFFASDYFEQMYDWAVDLIRKGKAFVCDLSAEELSATRGTLTSPGTESPYRNRSVEENLDLFGRMRAGEFPDGARTLRAKIDMASPNMVMRDPVMYRILHAEHHRQGNKWCIYPTYDWAHGLEDSIEGVTFSLCSQEYEIHRPLYDWFLDELGIFHPRQIEFARLNLTHTLMSKRRFIELVEGGHVQGYDDPRLPTLAGLRRRGYTPEAIREFCRRIGIAKTDSRVEVAYLEDTLREDLNQRSPRVMAVLDPLKVVLVNYSEGQTEELDVINNPEDPGAGTRKVTFARELFIERDDFREEPPPKFFRLAPGREVRLRNAYLIRCEEVVKDAAGRVVELRCTADLDSKSGGPTAGRKIKGTIHWVSAAHAVEAEVRLYDRLFTVEEPDAVEGKDFTDLLNSNALEVLTGCKLETSLQDAQPADRFQFERLGYFCIDSADQQTPANAGRPVFNRIITLRDSWAKAGR